MYRKKYNPNVEIERLIVDIENLRQDLINEVRQRYGFQDPEVIKLSQTLDISLNQYYRLTIDLGQK